MPLNLGPAPDCSLVDRYHAIATEWGITRIDALCGLFSGAPVDAARH
jgi:hypothetical protein